MTDAPLEYRKFFNPKTVERRRRHGRQAEAGDLRRDPVYVYDERIVLAVNVALATHRPLLVRGPSGSGKSSLARNAADVLGWRYYERVITSRTQARDLLWEIDLLRRLRDAQAQTLGDDYTPYVEPGVLWWAFEPGSAGWRGGKDGDGEPELADPAGKVDHPRAVVLLDEIDKADPDVPNNLLIPLGSLQFQVEETGKQVASRAENAPLVFITTNEERELPAAFLRRCVELEIRLPTRKRLVDIAKAHFPKQKIADLRKLAEALLGPEDPKKADEPVDVNPAEFVDTVRACDKLKVKPGTPEWKALTGSTVWKFGRTKGTGR